VTPPPAYNNDSISVDMADMIVDKYISDEESIPTQLKPCESERHIGVDQGINHFAMVAVDNVQNAVPKLVGTELYNLQKGLDSQRLDAMDLVILLQTKCLPASTLAPLQPVMHATARVVYDLKP